MSQLSQFPQVPLTVAQGWTEPQPQPHPTGEVPQAGQLCQQGQLVQEVLPRDVTPPPPEQEFGLFFPYKRSHEEEAMALLSAILTDAMCPHPSPAPTGIIFRVCLPHSVPAHSFFG